MQVICFLPERIEILDLDGGNLGRGDFNLKCGQLNEVVAIKRKIDVAISILLRLILHKVESREKPIKGEKQRYWIMIHSA